MKKIIYFLLITITIFLYDLTAYAATMYSECEYVMGDNDTKTDAKQLCLLEAKRKLLDEVGTYVESKTEVLNYNLTKDEIRAYTAGIVKIAIMSEKSVFNGQSIVLKIKIKADVDANSLQAKLLEIHQDAATSQKYRQLEEDYKNLEKQIRELQERLSHNTTNWEASEKARIERETAFSSLTALEQVKQDIQKKTYIAVQNVEIGMTREEVLKLVGPPRAENYIHNDLNYGKVWIIFDNNIVTVIVDAQCYNYLLHTAADYFGISNPCGAGKGIIKH